MHIINVDDILENMEHYKTLLETNKLFLYPTDSLYGLGTSRTIENIQKIATIKNRPEEKKMNIIAPSRDWIEEHFTIYNKGFLEEQYNNFHATTFILEPKSSEAMLYQDMYGDATVGVRLIKHPLQDFFTYCSIPIITTSANISGEPNIYTIDDISPNIKTYVDYCIDGGRVFGKPSVLVFDKSKEIRIRE